MYTVLIVDDEEPVIESYSFILEQGVDGFTLAGIARSGPEAVARINELSPDVVFMDINMPGFDGLEAISRVHECFPNTIFVLSTAYERFDIARKAIPLGVYAYLVKPVTRQLFVETLAGIKGEMEKRRASLSIGQSALLADRFLRETIWKAMDESSWREHRQTLHLDSDKGMVCFIGLDSEQENVYSRLNLAIDLKWKFLFTMHLNLGMYYFPSPVDPVCLISFLEKTIASQIPSGILAITGFGSVRHGTELYLSCTEALGELQHKRVRTDIRLRERLRIVQIRRKLGLSELEELRSIFTEYWEESFSSFPFALAKAKMVALFSLLIDDATGCYQSSSDTLVPFDPAEELLGVEDIAAWKDWAQAAFNRVYSLARLKRTGQFPVPLVKALSYIEECYDKQIQLSDVADAAQVSSAYVSKLFTEHLESTFVDYLTEIRVAHAERLIRENTLTIKEISNAVGYQDPNYFSKIFRKSVGISPSMYAQRSRYDEEK